MSDSQTRTVSSIKVMMPRADIRFYHNIWQTPVSRDAPLETTQETLVARENAIPVWAYVAAQRILGKKLYNLIKFKLRGER